MQEIKFYSGEEIPLELHKVRVVQKLHLVPFRAAVGTCRREDLTHSD